MAFRTSCALKNQILVAPVKQIRYDTWNFSTLTQAGYLLAGAIALIIILCIWAIASISSSKSAIIKKIAELQAQNEELKKTIWELKGKVDVYYFQIGVVL